MTLHYDMHCRHGKCRACFAVYVFLHLVYEMGDENVLCLVQMRVNNRGYPFINLMRQNRNLLEQSVDILGVTHDTDYRIYSREYGNHSL